MKKNNANIEFVGICHDLSSEGKGVVSYNGVIGFVDDLLPGVKAKILITYLKKDIFYGKVVSLLESSNDRCKPRCPHFKECGGCSVMHLNYPAQLKYKQNKVEQCLSRIGGLNVKINPTIGMDEPYCLWLFTYLTPLGIFKLHINHIVEAPVFQPDQLGAEIGLLYRGHIPHIQPDSLASVHRQERITPGIFRKSNRNHPLF